MDAPSTAGGAGGGDARQRACACRQSGGGALDKASGAGFARRHCADAPCQRVKGRAGGRGGWPARGSARAPGARWGLPYLSQSSMSSPQTPRRPAGPQPFGGTHARNADMPRRTRCKRRDKMAPISHAGAFARRTLWNRAGRETARGRGGAAARRNPLKRLARIRWAAHVIKRFEFFSRGTHRNVAAQQFRQLAQLFRLEHESSRPRPRPRPLCVWCRAPSACSPARVARSTHTGTPRQLAGVRACGRARRQAAARGAR